VSVGYVIAGNVMLKQETSPQEPECETRKKGVLMALDAVPLLEWLLIISPH